VGKSQRISEVEIPMYNNDKIFIHRDIQRARKTEISLDREEGKGYSNYKA
jgi:hypothetical protein